MANLGGSVGEAVNALDELDSEDTDGYESDEADVFERKKKFEKILKKFNRHRQETNLTLKGNDLRYNVYLRKLQKMTKANMSLDVIGYRDYVNNIKEFAAINQDLNAFALESLAVDKALDGKGVAAKTLVTDYAADKTTGLERVKKHSDSILFTLAKLSRTGSGFLNARDKAAFDEIMDHLELYLFNDTRIFSLLGRIHRQDQ